METNYVRQKGFFDPANFDELITVVGCGGIGSALATTLAKLGIQELMLIDPDRVEPHNIPNQIFKPKNIGLYKVNALAQNIAEISDAYISARYKKFQDVDSAEFSEGIVCSGLDSMSARASLWDTVKDSGAKAYFDGRLGGEKVVLYSVDLSNEIDKQAYAESLTAKSVEPLPCTRKSIIDISNLVSALMTRAVRNFLTEGSRDFVQNVDWEKLEISKFDSDQYLTVKQTIREYEEEQQRRRE